MVLFKRDVPPGNTSSDPEILRQLFGGIRSDTGERVNAESTGSIAGIERGIDFIGGLIAKTDIHHFHRLADNSRERIRGSWADFVLNNEPSPNNNCFSAMQSLIRRMKFFGNGYEWLQRNDKFEAVARFPMPSEGVYTIQVFDEDDPLKLAELFYAVPWNGGVEVIRSEDVIHLKNYSMDGVEGISLMQKFRQSIGLQIAQTRLAAIAMRKGSHITKYVKFPNWLQPEEEEQQREALRCLYEGIDNTNRLAVLFGGGEIGSLQDSLQEMQFTELMTVNLQTAANIVGISVNFLNGQGFTSYSSLQQMASDLLTFCLDPIYCQVEQEFTKKLLTPRQRADQYCEFERMSVFKGNGLILAELLKTQFESRQLSWEEVRSASNKDHLFYKPTELGKLNEPKPEPIQQPLVAPVTDELPNDEPQEVQDNQQIQRAIRLTEASLNRVKNRLIRAADKSNFHLQDHYEIIRSEFPDDSEAVIADLELMKDELDNLLPEQRSETLGEKWNTKQLATNLWNTPA